MGERDATITTTEAARRLGVGRGALVREAKRFLSERAGSRGKALQIASGSRPGQNAPTTLPCFVIGEDIRWSARAVQNFIEFGSWDGRAEEIDYDRLGRSVAQAILDSQRAGIEAQAAMLAGG
jgi:hypothetical protein